MAQFRDSIEMKVIIQGTEAINELGKLEAEAKDLRLSLKDIAKENEGFKQLEVSAKNLEKQYSKLDETLKTHTSTQTISKNKVDELTTKIQELEQAEVKDEKQIKELNKQREFHNRLLTNSTDNIENTNLRLAANAAEMKKVQSELKTTAKFTQEYIDTNAKIAGAEQKIKELREEYGLTAMTMQQLRKYQGELNRELDNVTFGTQAYKDLKIKIQEVSNTILSQKNDVKTVTQDFKVLVATVGLAGMTIEQLGDYQKELNQELKGVVFGTDAYKNLKNRIQDVNNAIENQQADLKTTTKYFKELISIVGISGLNIEQLADYQKELNQELNGVVFGTQAYKDLKNKIQEVNGVIENQKADLKASTQDFKALRAAVGLAGMTIEQLGDYQKQLNQELNGVVFGTAAYKDLKNRIQEVSGVIKNQQKDLQDTRTGWQKFKDEIKGFGVATLGNIGGEIAMRAFDGMTQALVGTVSQAAKLSDELADIQRFTGLSTEETKKLNSELSALNTRTGTGDLREITMIGGQLGVAKEEILGFVTSIDKANVALSKEFGGSAEAVANALGKIKNLFAETKNMKFGEAMERIGSALTAAGASSSASAPQISDFAQRLGAIGELGPKLTQTLGLGTALLDLGLSSEIAASGLQALFITAGKEAESFAKQIGISVEEFKKLQNNDPNKMLIDLAKSFKGLDNDEVLAGLLRMKITSGETVKVMALLKDNTEKVSAAQTLMANEFANNTKLQDAFNAKMSTFGAQVDLAKKEINGLVAGLTSALLPAMTKIVEKTVAFVIILKELPKFLKDNREVIATLVFALIGFNSSLIATQANILRTNFNFVVLNATMRAATLLMPIITTATAAWNAVLALNPLGLVIIAIAALVVGMTYLYNTNEKVKQGIDTLWEAYKTFVGAVIDFWVNVLTLDFSGAFDTLITAFKKVKNIFAEGITPTINEPVGSKLQSNEFKQQQQKQNKKDAGGLLFSFEPEEKPKQNDLEYMSYEDAALIAANKKRAADGAAADKAENDKKDAAAKERNNKLKEDRLKAEKDANEAIAALKLELLKDEEQKEIAQAKLANAKSLEKYQELFANKMISKLQFDEISTLQQETLNQKLFEIDNKWRAKTAEEILAANKKTFDEKLKNLESDKSLDDAQAGLNNVNAAADVADKFSETPELQDAALAALDYDQKQAALDREADFLNQKLELYRENRLLTKELDRENGLLTKELEDGFMAQQTDIIAKKAELELSNAKRISTEKELLRKKESDGIRKGLTQIGTAAGSIASSLEQLGIKNSAFGKALALTQIAISTGTALAESIPLAIKAASMSGPAAPFVFAGTLATITATVLGSIAQAKSVIEAAPTPTASAKGAESGASGGGNSGYVVGGYTGDGNIYEVAGVVHKGEYVIPAHLLKVPQIANFAAMTESIRTNKAGFIEGGYVGNTATTNYNPLKNNTQNIDNQQNTFNMQIMQTMNMLLEKVSQVNIKPAIVVATDMSEALIEKAVLDKDVKI